MTSWHTLLERKAIKKYGGKPLIKYGYDGLIRGRPVEVRAIKKDNRFRIQRNVHRELVRNGGTYIFVDAITGRSRRIRAKQVSKLIGGGKWFKDRKYPHKFVRKRQIF